MNIDETFAIHKLGPRSKAAYLAAWQVLRDAPDWVPWPSLVEAMLKTDDPITAKSASDLMRGMEYLGLIERRGQWHPRSGTDGREVRNLYDCATCGRHLSADVTWGDFAIHCELCWMSHLASHPPEHACDSSCEAPEK